MIPSTSPYGDGLTASYSAVEPNNNIVDWVWVELRDPSNNTDVIAARSALLQRDGDVVDVDGSASLSFNTTPGDYLLVIQHRNHLGVMSSSSITLGGGTAAVYDFTLTPTAYEGGTNATIQLANSNYALIAGDVNENVQVQVTDIDALLPFIGLSIYDPTDQDMNGEVQVSDINVIQPNIGSAEQY